MTKSLTRAATSGHMQGLMFVVLLADTKQYPAFVGHKPGRNNTQRHKLDIQLIMIMNRTLYIAARWVMEAVKSDMCNFRQTDRISVKE